VNTFSTIGEIKIMANRKDLDAVVDYCCFTLAIVMARLQIDYDNIEEQWSSVSVCAKLNLLPFADGPNFFINSSALSHGLLIFQKALRFFGLQSIPIYQDGKAVLPYFSLNYSRMSIEFKCNAVTNPKTEQGDLLSDILSNRNLLLKRSNYSYLERNTPSEAFGFLYLEMAVRSIPVKELSKEPNAEVTAKKDHVSFNLRKSPASLSSRSIRNVSKKIISSIDEKVGAENSFYFLKSAVKVLYKKRKLNGDEADLEVQEEEYEESDDERNEFRNEIIQEDSVQCAIRNLPSTNIVLSKEDKSGIMTLFDAIKESLMERECAEVDTTAVQITRQILGDTNYYCHVKTQDIRRWSERRERKLEKRGRKIDENFEAQVWGNLILCIFERNDEVDAEEVSYSNFSC
jgi:hypothetical protein